MANRFLVPSGDGIWTNTNNWAATDGGASGQTAPVAGDVVAFTSLSVNANMTVAAPAACASLIMSGTYAGTLTFDSTLTLTSTCTFLSTCTIAGTAGTLILSNTATITSGGKTLTCALTFSGVVTYTLADNWTVNGLTTAGVTSVTTLNGFQITCNGGFRNGGSTGTVGGSTKLVLAGGTLDSLSSGAINNPIDFAGTVTVSGAITRGSGAGIITYVSGTITTTGSTVTHTATVTLNTAGMTWANLTFSGAATYTLSSNLAWSATLTCSATETFTGAGTLVGPGGVTVSGAFTVTLNNTGGLVTTGTLTLPNAAATFAGSAGFNVGALTTASLSVSRIHTLTFGNTYVVTTAMGNVGTTAAIRQAIVSSSAGNKVVLNVTSGAALTLSYCDPTDVDSSAGGSVYTFGGTITTSLNWTSSAVAGGGQAAVGDVRSGTVYGGGTGTLTLPAQADVKTGTQYGSGGTEFTGSLAAGGGSTAAVRLGRLRHQGRKR